PAAICSLSLHDALPIWPRMSQISGMLISVYFLMSAICAVLLALAGMPVFEAVCHAMAAISTGGYSTRNVSLAAFPSPLIHWILRSEEHTSELQSRENLV